MATLAILSPHPDDAVLSLWHLLAAPGDVRVVNVFGGTPEGHGGDAWWDRLTGATDSVARVRERHAEDRAALALAGREPEDLGFLDGQYRTAAPAVDEIVERIAGTVGDGVTLLAPASLDVHRDHVLVRDAALRLRAAGREVELYADVPHCVTYGWPAWVTGGEPDPNLRPERYWEHCVGPAGVALGECTPDVRHLDADALAAKTEAVRAYRTQVPALEAGWSVLSDPEVLRHEVIWTLPQPATGCT